MTATNNKLSASIGPRSVKLEIGWFHGKAPALLGLTVCEWLAVGNGQELLYFCLLEMQVLKFTVQITYYPMRLQQDDLLI